MPKTQELSPIYQEISDFAFAEAIFKTLLSAFKKDPAFQYKWEQVVRKQFEKGVKKYGSTLDANNSQRFLGWYEEALEELVDFAAYALKASKTLKETAVHDPKLKKHLEKLSKKIKTKASL